MKNGFIDTRPKKEQKERADFFAMLTGNFVDSILRVFLSSLVFRIVYIILLWHTQGLRYNFSTN